MVFQEILRRKIIEDMLQTTSNSSAGWKTLVVDSISLPILQSVCNIGDLIDYKIPTVESLERKRKSNPNNDAVFFVYPTPESVRIILGDLEENKYNAAYVFSVAITPEPVVAMIRKSPARSKVKGLHDLCVDFFAFSPTVFHMKDMSTSLSLYTPSDTTELNDAVIKTSLQLLSIITALKEDPKIRYFDPFGTRKTLSARVAYQTQTELDLFKEDEPDYPPKTKYARAELIILDRSFDLISPLIHEITYQSLVHDLMAVDGHQVTFAVQGEETKTCKLDHTDSIWEAAKNMFLEDSRTEIQRIKDQFIKENPNAAAELGTSTQGGLDAIRERLNALPEYHEKKEKLSIHVDLLTELNILYSQRNLDVISDFEQDVVTGDIWKKSVNEATKTLFSIIQNHDINSVDKLRVLLIYVSASASNSLSEADLKKLMDDIGTDPAILRGLEHLSVGLQGVKWDRNGKYSYAERHKRQPKLEVWQNHRCEPILKYLLDDQRTNTLDQSIFPYITNYPDEHKDANSRGTGTIVEFKGSFKPNWGKRRRRGPDVGNGGEDYRENGRVIVFIIGGLSFPEIRVASEFSKAWKREVLIGSTSVLNPSIFVDFLHQIGQDSQQYSHTPAPQYKNSPVTAKPPVPEKIVPEPFVSAAPPTEVLVEESHRHSKQESPSGLQYKPLPSPNVAQVQTTEQISENISKRHSSHSLQKLAPPKLVTKQLSSSNLQQHSAINTPASNQELSKRLSHNSLSNKASLPQQIHIPASHSLQKPSAIQGSPQHQSVSKRSSYQNIQKEEKSSNYSGDQKPGLHAHVNSSGGHSHIPSPSSPAHPQLRDEELRRKSAQAAALNYAQHNSPNTPTQPHSPQTNQLPQSHQQPRPSTNAAAPRPVVNLQSRPVNPNLAPPGNHHHQRSPSADKRLSNSPVYPTPQLHVQSQHQQPYQNQQAQQYQQQPKLQRPQQPSESRNGSSHYGSVSQQQQINAGPISHQHPPHVQRMGDLTQTFRPPIRPGFVPVQIPQYPRPQIQTTAPTGPQVKYSDIYGQYSSASQVATPVQQAPAQSSDSNSQNKYAALYASIQPNQQEIPGRVYGVPPQSGNNQQGSPSQGYYAGAYPR